MKVPLFKIFWDDADILAVKRVIQSGVYWTTGPTIKEFEDKLAAYIGTKYALAFSSGTTALHSAIVAHGIKAGDEVIVPSFSFISTANVTLFERAVPVFADIEPKTFGLDPDSVNERITEKTKAIIPVHYGGSPCLIRALKEIAEDHNLVLIEDAAESMGSMVNNKKIGSFGDSAMFSFCQNKIITTGDGGAVVTDSKEVYERLKLLRSHGRLEPSNYFSSNEIADYVSLGYNYRMSDITAALGMSQLEKIDKIINLRRKNSKYLSSALSEVEDISVLKDVEDHFKVYQLYTILVNASKERDRLLKFLSQKGISSKVYFDPIHQTHFYKNVLGYDCELPVTEDISSRVLTLPMHPMLVTEELDYISNGVKDFFKNGGK